LYDAKRAVLAQQAAAAPKEVKDSSATAGWALPLFAAVAMFSFVSFIAVRRNRDSRSTRRVNVHEPLSIEEDAEFGFSSDDAPIE
jgi:hypothetical protein